MKETEDSVPNQEDWKTYLTGQGSAEERAKWEELLLEDEQALFIYMDALEDIQDELPEISDPLVFAARIMKSLHGSKGAEETRRNRWYEKKIFHYVVAASMTLLFLSSGVFDRLLTGSMEIVVESGPDTSSYSEQMMQATNGWIDQLFKDGTHREER